MTSEFRSILVCFALSFSFCSAAQSAASQSDPDRPPNVVMVLIDDLGWRDLGCFGSTFYETPQIDRLARAGMRFTTAYSAAPVCSPTRASLLTGKNPARLGFTGHITSILKYRYPERGRILPPQDHMRLRLAETTIAEALKPRGYVSASIGKWHLGTRDFWPTAQGFDVNVAGGTHGSPSDYFHPYANPQKTWDPKIPNLHGGKPGEYLTDRLTEESIRFIEKNRDRPFFLYLTHYAVHTPLQAPKNLIDKYQAKLKQDSSQKNATYAAMIESVDSGVGRLLATLDRLDLDEQTIVILYSDNGGLSKVTNNAPLRAGKQTLYEGGIRVPLIVKWPGQVPPQSLCTVPVTSDDLFPTILAMTGHTAATSDTLDGRSLVPLLEQSNSFPQRPLFWYYPHYARRPGAVVRDGDFKLIEHYDPPQVELYNLADDLSEQTDLSESMPQKMVAMRKQLEAWLQRVGAIRHTPNPAFRESITKP